MIDRLLVLAVRCLDDDARRADLISTARASMRGARAVDRVAEVLGVLALVLRLRARRATGDHPVAIWRQGIWLGGLVLAAGAIVDLGVAASAAPAGSDAERLAAVATVVGVGALVAAAGWVPPALAVLAPPALLLGASVILDDPAPGPHLVRLAVVVLAAVLGTPVRPVRRPVAVAAWTVPVLLGLASLATLPADQVSALVTVVLVGVVAGACLVAGWFDPRLAVAATVVWVWRFLAVDPPRLGDAVLALAGDLDLEALLVRWAMMAAGVVAGLTVSRISVRRAVAL